MLRRDFGRMALRLGAAFGLRAVGPRVVGLVAGAGVEGCGAARGSSDPQAWQKDAGPGPEELQDASLRDEASAGHSATIVVGSGYGSAVTALRLTRRGIRVTMLEMGRLWNTPGPDGKVFCPLVKPDGRSMWFKDRTIAAFKSFLGVSTSLPVPNQAGILDVLQYPNMDVYCGRGVGGGSLVNLAMYVTPLRDVFARVLPTIDAVEMFDKYYPRARSEIGTNTVRAGFFNETPWYLYSRAGWADAARAGIESVFLESGYDYAYMEQEAQGLVPASALNQEAAYGNNYGKRSLDKSYLADALATGLLTILALHVVKRIERAPDGTYVVTCDEIDIEGNVIATKSLGCTRLFLGGGSMGTTDLLMRARETGAMPDLSDKVGTAWGPNSDIFVARATPAWEPTGDKMSTVPAAGFRTLDQDGKNVFSMYIPFPVGIETYVATNIVMTENPEAGQFRYDAARDAATLTWQASQNEPAVRSATYVFDRINAAAGSTYKTDMFGGATMGSSSTYHPVGGCPIARATDDYGRITEYPGLYVVDGSLIPVGIGANPALTITALAERNVERVLAEDFRT